MILIDEYFANNSDKLSEALKSKDFSHDRFKPKLSKNDDKSM